MKEREICRTVREDLGEWARGALSPDRSLEIDAHLTSCADCRAEADQEQALVDLLGMYESEDPGPGFEASVMERIDREDRGGRTRGLRLAAVLGAGLAAAAAALLLVQQPGQEVGAGPRAEEIAMIRDLELYENLELVEMLDVLGDLEAIEALPEEEPI